uniref:Alternative protein KIAA0889 n=1 Tax=Homo sapiens TaxID=9606 RepID=L8E9V0_HUMAN|nr:alternative protein KIAA0889 [Homo sapiens]
MQKLSTRERTPNPQYVPCRSRVEGGPTRSGGWPCSGLPPPCRGHWELSTAKDCDLQSGMVCSGVQVRKA